MCVCASRKRGQTPLQPARPCVNTKAQSPRLTLYSVSLSSGIFSRLMALNLTVDSFLSPAWTPPLKSISI